MQTFEFLDWLVLGAYFAVLIAVAVWISLKREDTASDYFLAGRNAGWFVIGASIFASNIGSEHVVGLAGTGAASGMPMAHYELHAWIVLVLGWLFLPFYMRSGVYTMPAFLERRFDSRSGWFLSIFSIIGYVLTKVSVTIYAGGVVVSQLLDIPFMYGAIGTVVLTGAYTIFGGMRAVMYTEAFQTVILILGAVLLTWLGMEAVGGWGELKRLAGPDHFDMWRPSSDPDYPWTGMLFGGTVVGIWYWCTDQYIVQRTLAAGNITIGRRGAIFGAYLKLLPVFIFLVPGMIAFALKQKGVLHYDKSDEVYPALVQTLLPTGLRGLVAGGLMAALMSSLASVFNSSATLFTVDIFKKMSPDSTERTLVRTGQWATAVVVLLGLLWIPVMEKIGGGVLYRYLQSVQSYIAPPIAVVFLMGILWKRVNGQAAIATLGVGLLAGSLRIVAELTAEPGDGLWHDFAAINFAHMAVYMFLSCAAVCTLVTLVTKAPDPQQIEGLAFGTGGVERQEPYSITDLLLTGVLVAIILGIMVYFT